MWEAIAMGLMKQAAKSVGNQVMKLIGPKWTFCGENQDLCPNLPDGQEQAQEGPAQDAPAQEAPEQAAPEQARSSVIGILNNIRANPIAPTAAPVPTKDISIPKGPVM